MNCFCSCPSIEEDEPDHGISFFGEDSGQYYNYDEFDDEEDDVPF